MSFLLELPCEVCRQTFVGDEKKLHPILIRIFTR
jgi:hypothetical protein